MSSDWWSRKLNGDPAGTTRVSTPPVGYQERPGIRIGIPPQQQRPAPVQPQRTDVLDPNRAPSEQVTMGEAIRMWRGGEATRRETMTCPSCGSGNVFSRSKGMINGANPAPRCYECGWNGRYEQGDESNWV